MEIESLLSCASACFHYISKQRKSPENGDWKGFSTVSLKTCLSGNKESLLKMEIESCIDVQDFYFQYRISKQRKSPENGDWKVLVCCCCFSRKPRKQRKSPENGDWKPISITSIIVEKFLKQRKSPENGDWKLQRIQRTRKRNLRETKKVSWKWRLKAILPPPAQNLSFRETKKVSWKWRLKVKYPVLGISVVNQWNKESLLKMEIESARGKSDASNSRWETKKVSWKWRLKDMVHRCPFLRRFFRNKESLLKMEIERACHSPCSNERRHVKQRKSPENGDWKS